MTTTAQEELAFIRKVMADSQTIIVDDGKPGIAWAIIVSIGMSVTYLVGLGVFEFDVSWLWIGLSVLGWGYISWYKSKKIKQDRMRTLAGKIIGSIWGACGFCIGLTITLVFVAPHVSGEWVIHPVAITSIVSIMLGMAYFVTGVVYGKTWVRYISLGWWLGAIGMLLWPTVHVLGIYTVMLILFQLVPGIVLYRQSKQALSNGAIES